VKRISSRGGDADEFIETEKAQQVANILREESVPIEAVFGMVHGRKEVCDEAVSGETQPCHLQTSNAVAPPIERCRDEIANKQNNEFENSSKTIERNYAPAWRDIFLLAHDRQYDEAERLRRRDDFALRASDDRSWWGPMSIVKLDLLDDTSYAVDDY